MSLPSQRRSFGSRSSRKRRRKGPPIAVFVVPLGLIGIVGLWWILGGGTANNEDTDSITDAADTSGSLAAMANETLASNSLPTDVPIEVPVRGEQESGATTIDPVLQDTTPVTTLDPVIQPPLDQPPLDTFQPAVEIAALLDQATSHLNRGELVSARAVLSDALNSNQATDADRARIRDDLTTINQELFFSSKVYPGDTLSEIYEIQSGNSLAGITKTQSLTVDWRLIQRINRISDPSRIRVGQKIKLVRGPIHAVVSKSKYRIDLYAGPPGAESQWMFIRSFPVGLGSDNSTPIGEFVVRNNSKLINPVWRNPRTGEHFAADNPENPIGERWIGIEGVGDSAVHDGYGIHGTIDPASIGNDASMGCIRMNDDAVEVIYEMLVEQVSQVSVRP